jgi:anti-sigma B factor antagonist
VTVDVVRAPVEVDVATVPAFGRMLTGAFEHARGGTIEVDMTAMEFIDSAGLGLLVVMLKRTRHRGGALCLTHVSERVMRTFRITGLDAVFDLRPA